MLYLWGRVVSTFGRGQGLPDVREEGRLLPCV